MSNLLIRLGSLIVVLSVSVILIVMYPVLVEEIKFLTLSPDENVQISTVESEQKNTIVVADKNFSLVVPKIGANAKIVADVDPHNPTEYQQKLTQGVAHAKGSVRPGQLGSTFLFAHSSDNFYNANRYNSVFYLLRKLENKDKFFVAYDSKIYEYEVTETSIVEPDAVEYLMGDPTKETVTLMTCWPPGTTFQRLLVVGERSNPDNVDM